VSKVKFQQAISLDGYSAGPDQSEEHPLGTGGEELHEWMFGLEAWLKPHGKEGGEVNASTPVVEELESGYGARVMGRNMFGPVGGGDWGDGSWRGWWGDNPPYHTPVFVLTHHPREPVEMEGGTTFHFVTDGIESAIGQAREAAGDEDVLIAGGANTIGQALAAGLVDEFLLSVTPRLLGDGERPLDGVGPDLELEQLESIEAPGVTHLRYRVVK
jgi:dihydrofolate reductase